MKWWARLRRRFLRARVREIEATLWKNPEATLRFGFQSVDEQIGEINDKLDLLADVLDLAFKDIHKSRRVELISKEQADAERAGDRDALWS